MTSPSKLARRIRLQLGRIKYTLDCFTIALELFPSKQAVVVGLKSLQRGESTMAVVPLDFESAICLRVGRTATDLRVLRDVVGTRAYDVSFGRNPKWIIDAGANVGFSVIWLASRYPDANIVAIEPDQSNYELLSRNTKHLPRVHLVNAALTSFEGQGDLVDPGLGAWGLRVVPSGQVQQNLRTLATVRCTTVPAVMDEFGIGQLDLLKIDIEGGEVEVFNSSAPWIDRIAAVSVELHDRFRPGCARSFCEATQGFSHTAGKSENIFVWR